MALLALCISYFMVIIDVTIVTVALPTMGGHFHCDVAGQWIVDGYTLVLASLLLSTGVVADRWGGKRTFEAGLMAFVLASLGGALAQSLTWLVVMRLLQGCAAALLIPTSMSLVKKGFTERAARALGAWAAVGGVAAALGPVLGALLVAGLGWRAVFWVNLPMGVLAWMLSRRGIPEIVAEDASTRLDLMGQVLAILALSGLATALIANGHAGWRSAAVLLPLGLSVPAGMLFLRWEHRTTQPMVPLRLFRQTDVAVAMLVGLGLNLGFYGQLFLLPFYFEQIHGLSVFAIGFAMLPQPAMAALASFLSGKLMAKVGPRGPMCLGLWVGAVGFAGLSIAVYAKGPYASFVAPLLAIGFGTAFTMPAMTSAMLEAVSAHQAGIASGCLNASRQMGSMIGVAMAGTLIALPGGITSALVLAALLGAAIFAVSAMASACSVRPGNGSDGARIGVLKPNQ